MKDLIKEICKNPHLASLSCALKEKPSDLDEFYCTIYRSEKEKWGDYFALSAERPARFQVLTAFLAKTSDDALLYLNKEAFLSLSMVLEEHFKGKDVNDTTTVIVTPEAAKTVAFKNFAKNLSPQSSVFVSAIKEKELSKYSFQIYNAEKFVAYTKEGYIAFLYPDTETKRKRIASMHNSFRILLQHSVRYDDFLNAPQRITSHKHNTPCQNDSVHSRD